MRHGMLTATQLSNHVSSRESGAPRPAPRPYNWCRRPRSATQLWVYARGSARLAFALRSGRLAFSPTPLHLLLARGRTHGVSPFTLVQLEM
jgi:hypothetical protein